MKQRKEARKERAEKKVKTVIVDGDRETPYDFEKVLLELGEADSNKKANSSKGEVKYYLNYFYKPNIFVRNR